VSRTDARLRFRSTQNRRSLIASLSNGPLSPAVRMPPAALVL